VPLDADDNLGDGPVVVGNDGDNNVRHLADTTPICYLCGVARDSRQPMTGRLATHPSNTTVKIYMLSLDFFNFAFCKY